MTRPAVCVREVTRDDVPALLGLWAELRDMGGWMERIFPGLDADDLGERLAGVAEDPDARALVAEVDGVVAGMTLLTAAPYAPLVDQRAVHSHYLHVKDGYRRRGVGKALLTAAVTFADEVGADHVLTSVLPQLRETQRFYARLGFGPVVVRRSAAVSVLRRRLMPSGAAVTDNLLARRRSLRRVRVRAAVARVGD